MTNVLSGTVESAFPLEPETITILEEKFKKVMGRRIKFNIEVNPEIIGGLKIIIGDRYFDCSISSKLSNMKRILVEED